MSGDKNCFTDNPAAISVPNVQIVILYFKLNLYLKFNKIFSHNIVFSN